MLAPLTQFICDTCGQVIERPEDGWVEWISDFEGERPMNRGFRITHHHSTSPIATEHNEGCYKYTNHSGRSDLHLHDFISEEYKMAEILSYLDIGPYHDPTYHGPYVNNMREYVEFVRRLTIPYYEEARQYWQDAIDDGYFGDCNELWLYGASNLKRLIEQYSEE